jgi:hypothetical protein
MLTEQDIERIAEPCPKCGQVPNGQHGEYPCAVCGLPVVWDDETLIDDKYRAARFGEEVIDQIISDGDWEYGDGTSMTQDAKAFKSCCAKIGEERDDYKKLCNQLRAEWNDTALTSKLLLIKVAAQLDAAREALLDCASTPDAPFALEGTRNQIEIARAALQAQKEQ